MSREQVVTIELRGPFGGFEFAGYLARLDALLERGEPFAMVIDGSKFEPAFRSLPSREWGLARTKELQALHRGIVFVVGDRSDAEGARLSSEDIRALCTMQPPGVPYAFVESRDEAIECACGWLDAVPVAIRGQQPTMPMMIAVGRR